MRQSTVSSFNITVLHDRENKVIKITVYDTNFKGFKEQWETIETYLVENIEERLYDGSLYHPTESFTDVAEWSEYLECYIPKKSSGNLHEYYFEYE